MKVVLFVALFAFAVPSISAAEENLLKNPSFETGDFAQWSVWGEKDATWRIGTGNDAHAGKNGAVFETSEKTSSNDVWYGAFQNVDVEPGTSYRSSAWLRLGNAEWNTVRLEVKWIDDEKKETIAATSQDYSKASTENWQYFKAELPEMIAPEGAVQAKVQVVIFLTGDPTDVSFTTFDEIVFERSGS